MNPESKEQIKFMVGKKKRLQMRVEIDEAEAENQQRRSIQLKLVNWKDRQNWQTCS